MLGTMTRKSKPAERESGDDDRFAVKIPSSYKADLQKLATAHHRTMTGEVIFLIEEALYAAGIRPRPAKI